MEILACPIDKFYPLELLVFEEKDEITSGIITCPKCNRWYPIIDEIIKKSDQSKVVGVAYLYRGLAKMERQDPRENPSRRETIQSKDYHLTTTGECLDDKEIH